MTEIEEVDDDRLIDDETRSEDVGGTTGEELLETMLEGISELLEGWLEADVTGSALETRLDSSTGDDMTGELDGEGSRIEDAGVV